MSFREYINDKRFFLIFYFIIMLFVSLIVVVSVNGQYAVNYFLYMNGSCLLVLILYMTIGFLYRNKFYKGLTELIESEQEGIYVSMLEPQNYEQKLFLSFLQKIQDDNSSQLQQLHDEKHDQQEFIMSWIHEVKLPIAASQLLIENSEGKSGEWLIDKLEDELDKIDNYVEQALYYSRIDSFSKDYFITDVQLNQMIKNSVKKYSKLFINKGIHFEMDEVEQYVHSDGKWLGFVIDQIIANSLKYTHEGGKITIHFEEDRKEKKLLIQDNGIGIKVEDLNRVFEKGFTGFIGRSHRKSTGMGLYLAKQLAKKLGHDLTIESEEGKYTRVVIHFPKVSSYYYLNKD